MKPFQREICINIVRKLRDHPASGPFRKPVSVQELPNYYEIIDDPQDLSTIEEKLKNEDIRSLREFKRDMSTIWSNAEYYSGKDSYPADLARYCAKLFEKELKKCLPTSTAGWFSLVNTYQMKFQQLLTHPPEKVEESVPIEMRERKSLVPFSGQEYQSLFNAVTNMSNQEDQKSMMKMLGKPKSVHDLTKASLVSLRKASDIIKEKSKMRAMQVVASQ